MPNTLCKLLLCWPRSWGQKRQSYTECSKTSSRWIYAPYSIESACKVGVVSGVGSVRHTAMQWLYQSWWIETYAIKPMQRLHSAFVATHEPTMPGGRWRILPTQIFCDAFVVDAFWYKLTCGIQISSYVEYTPCSPDFLTIIFLYIYIIFQGS